MLRYEDLVVAPPPGCASYASFCKSTMISLVPASYVRNRGWKSTFDDEFTMIALRR